MEIDLRRNKAAPPARKINNEAVEMVKTKTYRRTETDNLRFLKFKKLQQRMLFLHKIIHFNVTCQIILCYAYLCFRVLHFFGLLCVLGNLQKLHNLELLQRTILTLFTVLYMLFKHFDV